MHIIYITCPTKEEAIKISHHLLEKNLIACSNIFDNTTSIYKWENQIQQKSESILIAKTNFDRVEEVINEVNSIHSYDCPCIFSIKTEKSAPEFRKWVENCLKLPY